MRKIIVFSMMTLDGVMQAPGAPEEDTSGDFKYGGWSAPYEDEAGEKVLQKELAQPTDYLLGRRTFEIFAAYWPQHSDVWPGITTGTKYVLSQTLNQSDWENTVFIQNLEAIKQLKQSEGADIQVWGSSELIKLLLKHDLVDELKLKIYPITLGDGKKWLDNGPIPAAFTLTESLATPSGAIILLISFVCFENPDKRTFQELHSVPFGSYGQFTDKYGVGWVFKADKAD